jgi:hypothetical protein
VNQAPDAAAIAPARLAAEPLARADRRVRRGVRGELGAAGEPCEADDAPGTREQVARDRAGIARAVGTGEREHVGIGRAVRDAVADRADHGPRAAARFAHRGDRRRLHVEADDASRGEGGRICGPGDQRVGGEQHPARRQGAELHGDVLAPARVGHPFGRDQRADPLRRVDAARDADHHHVIGLRLAQQPLGGRARSDGADAGERRHDLGTPGDADVQPPLALAHASQAELASERRQLLLHRREQADAHQAAAPARRTER